MPPLRWWWVLIAAGSAVACGTDSAPGGQDSVASIDAAPDSGYDSGPDSGHDSDYDSAGDASDGDASPEGDLDTSRDIASSDAAPPDAWLDTLPRDSTGPDATPDSSDDSGDSDHSDGTDTTASVSLHPIITELVASNQGSLFDGDGDTPDWIELFNPHDVSIDLGQYTLRDEPTPPEPWSFPPGTWLPPRRFVVVFASEKATDSAPNPPSGELHANFRLDADGETIWLHAPDGQLVQAVEFGPLAPDVAYGVPFEFDTLALVSVGDTASYLAPTWEQALDPNANEFADLGFDDSSWSAGPTGIGYAVAPPPSSTVDLGAPHFDSFADWSPSGQQGANGWTYGYWAPAGAEESYAPAAFQPFPHANAPFGETNYWNGVVWDWPNGNPPWTVIGPTAVHGNGPNSGPVHWPIRRWTADLAGTVLVEWTLRKSNLDGAGVSGHLFHEVELVDTAAVAGTDFFGVSRIAVIPDVQAGDTLDLAHDPTGPTGDPNDFSDGSDMTIRGWMWPDGSALVATPLSPSGPPAGGNSPGLWLRHAFTWPTGDPLHRVSLRIWADDGVTAWIDANQVAEHNAPDGDGGGIAPVDRPASQAALPVEFDVDLDALNPSGPGLLALRVYDSAVADHMLFAAAELLAHRLKPLAIESPTWLSAPTPGADNAPAASDIGPYLISMTDGSAGEGAIYGAGDAIEVTVTVEPTLAPVSQVTLYTRVDFAPESPLECTEISPGVWSATIPDDTAAVGHLLRWRVEAADTENRISRLPEFLDPLDSEEYVGTVIYDPGLESAADSSLPVLHWFIDSPSAANSPTGARAAVFFGGELYDNIRVDLHGQSTTGFPKKSYDFDFNATHRFRMVEGVKRMKDVNLLTNFADKTKARNTLAYRTYQAAGTGYHLAFPVRVQQNGAFFSVADLVEDGDDRWLERLGLDPDGNLYKMYDSMKSVEFGEQKTNKGQPKDDLQQLLDVLQAAGAALEAWLWDHVDIPGMVSFAAAYVIASNGDCCHKNYYAYHDVHGSGEWVYFPWDVDLTFGHNWTSAKNYFDETLYWDNALEVGKGNALLGALYSLPRFQEMYRQRLRTLADELLQTEQTPLNQRWLETQMIDIQSNIGAAGSLDNAAWPSWWAEPLSMDGAFQEWQTQWLPLRRLLVLGEWVATGELPQTQVAGPGSVRIDSWQAGEPTEQWIRLSNPGSAAVDVSNWTLDGDIALVLKPGTVIPGGDALFVVADVNGFRARTTSPKAGEKRFVQGSWMWVNPAATLAANPSVELRDAAGTLIDAN